MAEGEKKPEESVAEAMVGCGKNMTGLVVLLPIIAIIMCCSFSYCSSAFNGDDGKTDKEKYMEYSTKDHPDELIDDIINEQK